MAEKDPYQLLKHSQFILLFEQAEKAIKEVERVHENLPVPAINELRYAAYHIKNFIKSPEIIDEIAKAEAHCQRAIYDAYEAGILFYHSAFHKFKDDYRNVVITDVIPEYIDYKEIFEASLEYIQGVDKENKEQVYKKCAEYHAQLRQIISKLDVAREELNKKIEQSRKKFMYWSLSVLVSLATIIVSVILGWERIKLIFQQLF